MRFHSCGVIGLLACAFFWNSVDGQFCSFFGNKSPSPQPGLQNCTWYRESSCCVNEEITSLFSKVEVPANSNGHCRNYINYLMCYVCDPMQSNFYAQERLTVCEDFCDDVLAACANAVLKGTRLGSRYANGSAFCADRRFQVSTASESCFSLEKSKRTLNSGSLAKPNVFLILLAMLGVVGVSGRKSAVLLLGIAGIMLLLSGRGEALASDSDIKTMAASIRTTLLSVASNGIKRTAVQSVYDGATSVNDGLNVTYILGNIEEKLMSLTDDLNFAANAVKTAVRDSINTAGPPTIIGKSPGLDTLSRSVFLDADSIFDSPALEVQYNSTFRRYVSFQQSSVKVPSDVDYKSSSVYDEVKWSAGIDSVLRTLQLRRNTRWAYFGSENGIYRSFPASEWGSNFAGFRTDYDARTRPWYLAATSGPKVVGIFLDCSVSMGDYGNWAIAKAAVKQIVNSLSRDDQVNIVCSRGGYINRGGRRVYEYPSILGCKKTSMMRATASNRAQLLEQLDLENPYGSGEEHNDAMDKLTNLYPTGTGAAAGCEKVLIVISDGRDTDDGAFRNICYDKNRGSYGCNLLRTNFSPLYTKATTARNKGYRIVGIEAGNLGSTLPGKIGCDNGGIYVRLQSTGNIRTQLSPYYSYLARLADTDNDVIRPTSPYVDVSGLGRIISLSRSVYHPRYPGTLVGVVGVDAVLDDVENTLLDDQFGLSYAFLIDSDGRAIIHPRLKPSAELVDDPVYPHISQLEVHNSLPTEFSTPTTGVLPRMLNQNTGSVAVIGPRAQQRGGLQDGVVWINDIPFTYHFSAVTSTQYSFAFVLTADDAEQTMLASRAYTTGQGTDYYHEISKYNTATKATIDYTTNDLQYANLAVARNASTFKLAAQAFCDPTRYLLSDVPNFTTVDTFFNGASMAPSCGSAGALFVPEVRSTVWVTQPLETTWKTRIAAIADQVVWTYFGSANGMWRSYPGSRSTRDYDPTRRPWYHRALANNPAVYATSAVYLDAGGVGKVVTLAQTIFQTRAMSATGVPASGKVPSTECSATSNRAGNCACTAHNQCKSLYCYGSPTRCANPKIAGVGAVDIRYNKFTGMIEAAFTTQGLPASDRCTTNGTRCMLINDAAEVVYDQSFQSAADGDPRNYQNVPLGYLNGAVMLDLLNQGIFDRFSFVNLQGTCQTAPYAARASDRDLLLSAEQRDNFYINRGPIPRFQNDYGCQLDQIQYQRNTTVDLTNSVGKTFTGPCGKGNYRIFPVPETNLLLLIVETTEDWSTNFFNFNCHVFNNVARSGGFESRETACGKDFADSEVRGTCPRKIQYSPPCAFSTAAALVSPSLMLALVTIIASLLL